MLDVSLRPLDIIVFKGNLWKPTHSIVMWRSLSQYSHCVMLSSDIFKAFDPNIDGLKKKDISHYTGSNVVICRLKSLKDYDLGKICSWAQLKFDLAKGYDFLAWLGFATGVKYLQDENKWYCAEFPYWAFMEAGVKLTNKPLTFVYPSFFVESPLFEIIYDGEI